jgi:hypothetical protein
VVTGVYYFTTDAAKAAAAETETSAGGLRFHADRNPRAAAKDRAVDEIRRGNVCLRQAQSDLRAALDGHRLDTLCDEIFADELPSALKTAAGEKLRPDSFRCAADAEAHEDGGSVRMVLSFRGWVVTHEPVPAKLRRAGFPEDASSLPLPVHEAAADAAPGWKGALKAGACGFDEDSLQKFLERFRQAKRDARALARCRGQRLRLTDRIARLQTQLREYVPEEWVREAGDGEAPALLAPPAAPDAYAGLAECCAARDAAEARLERLRKVSGEIADRHDVPALDPEKQPGARSPASEHDY